VPRKPSVRYFPSRNAYYCQIGGVQHKLADAPAGDDYPDGPCYKAALKEFLNLSLGNVREGEGICLTVVLEEYAKHLEAAGKRSLWHWVRMMNKVNAALGRITVAALKPFHVQQWLDGQTRWSPGTKKLALERLNRALNWSVQQGRIPVNPIRGRIEMPQAGRRGQEYVLPEEFLEIILKGCHAPMRAYLRALRDTGARPGEIAAAEAQHYDPRLRAFVFRWDAKTGFVHKTTAKTRRDRVIHLTDDLAAMVEGLIAKYPTGPLFRNSRGKPYTPEHRQWHLPVLRESVAVKRWMEAHGFAPRCLTYYSFRHTFITNWVASGRSIKICADLCGTSAAMIEKHYSHADGNRERMHDWYVDFMAQFSSGS
jgi:integrase